MPVEDGRRTTTRVVLPTDLLASVDRLVGRRGRSRFVAQAVAEKLTRLRREQLLTAAAGALAGRDAPGWEDGAGWVRDLRVRDNVRGEARWRRTKGEGADA